MGNLGNVQLELGELPAARATLERALAIEETYRPDNPKIATTLTNLGIVQRELGELPVARATLERALAMKEAAYGPDHPEVAMTLGNLGKSSWSWVSCLPLARPSNGHWPSKRRPTDPTTPRSP